MHKICRQSAQLRICIPQVDSIIERILLEAYGLWYPIHLGVTKIY